MFGRRIKPKYSVKIRNKQARVVVTNLREESGKCAQCEITKNQQKSEVKQVLLKM